MAIATQDFIQQIDQMTVLELNGLVKALEEHYGVSAAAAAVAMPAGGGAAAAAPVGKLSFGTDRLKENADALIGAVMKAKPSAAKGKYVKSVALSSTMGPGIKVDEAVLTAATPES